LIFLFFIFFTDHKSTKSTTKPYVPKSQNKHNSGGAVNYFDRFDKPANKLYTRPPQAPNGNPWPKTTAYVSGYPLLNANGLSTVTIDNSQNSSDVSVKLFYLDETKNYPVRHVYFPAYSKRTLNKVTAGNYDIRYQDLTDLDPFRGISIARN